MFLSQPEKKNRYIIIQYYYIYLYHYHSFRIKKNQFIYYQKEKQIVILSKII